ncbi:MAG: DUF2332 family protein [Hyphomonadaceae bacterium]
MSLERVLAHFDEQGAFCTLYGSPFTGELIARMRQDIVDGGPMAALVDGWPTNPRGDALALRFTGALHAAVLMNRDPVLVSAYPGANAAWRMDDVWPVARAFLAREQAWVADFVKSAPQTNETRRSIALLAAFLAFAETWQGSIDTLELGASAGLNLNWDRFAYRTESWSWGGASPVLIDTAWNGPAPATHAQPRVRNRAGCDLNPLDIRDQAQRLQLKSYIWPDQPDRLTRSMARSNPRLRMMRVERASADAWVARAGRTRRRRGDDRLSFRVSAVPAARGARSHRARDRGGRRQGDGLGAVGLGCGSNRRW